MSRKWRTAAILMLLLATGLMLVGVTCSPRARSKAAGPGVDGASWDSNPYDGVMRLPLDIFLANFGVMYACQG